ncbi:hypothetical protein [Streptomyces sp. NPDC001530]|uniref:hypothetical protein n=1 Tax=Streptomyces sp. NPDC001530 TaxID=3364582 RepID=UPI0036B62512
MANRTYPSEAAIVGLRRWLINRQAMLGAALEVLAWWAALAVLWLVLISTVDTLELVVGVATALVSAVAAWAARRAVSGR